MPIRTITLQLSTQGENHVIDITPKVNEAVGQSGISSGLVTIFTPSSTSALTTMEFEPGAISDLKRMFDELIPADRPYAHNAAWGDGNGHSHIRAALLGPSLSVPFVDRHLMLGTWQQIIYVDFDNRPRQRKLVIQLMGE